VKARRLAVAAAAVVVVLAGSSCVRPASGDPDAFCTEVRRTAPSLLEELRPADVDATVRRAAKALLDHTPEALVDDVEVVATSHHEGELERALAAVQGYARAVCEGSAARE
jgi:sirohydrochlorin ferrochelatase